MKLFFLLLLACTLGGRAAEAASQPTKPGPGAGTGTFLISFFRNHISAVDGDRCPSYPSCTSYSLQAFEKHGFVAGWIMTVDRLIHEGSEELRVSPLVYQGGRPKIFDPVENNDFWWFEENDRVGHK